MMLMVINVIVMIYISELSF